MLLSSLFSQLLTTIVPMSMTVLAFVGIRAGAAGAEAMNLRIRLQLLERPAETVLKRLSCRGGLRVLPCHCHGSILGQSI